MPLILIVLLFVCSASCASTSSAPAELELPTRISFRDYRGDTHFSLVNEGHTSRVELYSSKRSNAITKVASDEIVAALLEFIDGSSYADYARNGQAPVRASQWIQAIEVQSGNGIDHILLAAKSTDSSETRTFRKVRDAFLDTYNNVFQAQAVQAEPGETVFKTPQYNKKRD